MAAGCRAPVPGTQPGVGRAGAGTAAKTPPRMVFLSPRPSELALYCSHQPAECKQAGEEAGGPFARWRRRSRWQDPACPSSHPAHTNRLAKGESV